MSVALAILAALASPYLPYDFGGDLGQKAVGTTLQIMASSMLAVTTFSLAYASATQLATPRATQLLISDPSSPNALSTFLGVFVFAIVGIIGLQTSVYGTDGRIILFGATILVIIWVAVTLLRWIAHITAFGRMSDIIDRVEDAAGRAMMDFANDPYLGGRPAVPVPEDARFIRGKGTEYDTHLDIVALGQIAARCGLTIHIGAFTIERHRSFDQDSRLGLIALSEIASRALAPATNDPGTAIEVLNALLRVLLRLSADEPGPVERAERPRVHLPRPSVDEMLTDAFRPILREGGKETKVTIRLTGTLAALYAALPGVRIPSANSRFTVGSGLGA